MTKIPKSAVLPIATQPPWARSEKLGDALSMMHTRTVTDRHQHSAKKLYNAAMVQYKTLDGCAKIENTIQRQRLIQNCWTLQWHCYIGFVALQTG